jgi:hypothetical protein
MIFVYSEHITERFTYVCEFVFKIVLKQEYKIIDDINLADTDSAIISYSKDSSRGLHVYPYGLLSENGIRNLNLKTSKFKGLPIIFETGKSDLPFDIFSMVFYFISRYEEYLVFKSDEHQRFLAEESFAFKNGILQIPIVDKVIRIFENILFEKYSQISFIKPEFLYQSTIDVDNAYHVKGKSFSRFLGASIKNILNLDFKEFIRRISILFKLQKDSFDNYDEQIEISKKYNIPLTYFVLYSRIGKFDRSLPPKNYVFEKLIDKLYSSALFGIHPSYHSSDDKSLMKIEISSIRSMNKNITRSRQHFLRLKFPETFNALLENEIFEDFSIGFSNCNGFRAGTAYPFYFFDLSKDLATPLRLYPFHVMDSVFYDYQAKTFSEAWDEIKSIVDEIKVSGGTFISVWHDRAFDEISHPGWKDCYIKLHEYCVNDTASGT